jgi:hypothetical protein
LVEQLTLKQKSKLNGPRYQRRIILFIDFLGFRELVERTVHEPDLLPHLIKAMERVGDVARGYAQIHKSQRISQFSDSIVVSYRANERAAAFQLLSEVAFCVIDLVERGFLLRGGLTVGDLMHTKKHVVGPAMVAAYDLESKIAKYPRVVVDTKLLDVARAARLEHHTATEEEGYVRSFLTKDADGRYYFDYISWRSVVAVTGGDNALYPSYIEKLGRLIENGLRHDKDSVLEKYLWLHAKYVREIETFRSLPSNHGYWRENPRHQEAFDSLPRYFDLAAAAKIKVYSQPDQSKSSA